MNSKNIAKSLHSKIDDWINNINNNEIRKQIKENAIVTGGAIVSLLTGEEPHDYDIYFKTLDSCFVVAKYYVDMWSKLHPNENLIFIEKQEDRVLCTVKSNGVVIEDGEKAIDDDAEPIETEEVSCLSENKENIKEENDKIKKLKYRTRYISSNAISLSDKIQIVIRFVGTIEDIHKNYDFVHCTCSYDYATNKVHLPAEALECIINKELIYIGSKYPLCSIIRTRKFIKRGWTINAGQYLKMALQLNKLNLLDLNVFKEQLTGVDSYYFEKAINQIMKKKEDNPDFNIDNEYLFTIINRIF